MGEKEREEQLRAFFEHQPLDEDMQYLKSYVREHPDNKMGWYLLGKEYEARDKAGKARYCFAQAGEVYEAFEKQKMRLGFKEALQADRTVVPGQSRRHGRLYRIARLTAALLVAALLGSFLQADGRDGRTAEPVPQERISEPQQQTAANEGAAPALRILYGNPLDRDGETEIWKRLLLPGEPAGAGAVLVEGKLTSDGKWINGLRRPELLASSRKDAAGVRVEYHKAELCNCVPGNAESVRTEAEAWFTGQEESVILRSAVQAYRSKYGEPLPDTLDGLIRNYPRNILPGYTASMKKLYEAMLSGASAEGTVSDDGSPSRTGTTVPGNTKGTLPAEADYMKEPLEIIVDKANFRLALVSGRVILRNYPVGLGGSKTPEGVFVISEKVKHPNGRDDGDFGSRGMQLSDTDYAIHGTKDAGSIGENKSLGCVRMGKEDIEELFDMAPSGTKVTIGTGLLPTDILRGEEPFHMPALREESNPGKTYHWLD